MPDPLDAQYQAALERLVAARPAGEAPYFSAHRQRYLELFRAVSSLAARFDTPRLLEIGVSTFLPLYRELLPGITLTTIDRPTSMGGIGREFCCGIAGAARHAEIDLVQQSLSARLGNPPVGQHDIVICTELLEHLPVNPVEFLGGLMDVVAPGGYLYLTTPNFFSWAHLDAIARRESPLPVFPRRGNNWDCHHHYREYGMTELRAYLDEAGGDIVAAEFSACWDQGLVDPARLAAFPDQASNLVVVATPRPRAYAGLPESYPTQANVQRYRNFPPFALARWLRSKWRGTFGRNT